MRVAALVLAAGRGERFGAAIPKAFVPLRGRPILEWSLRALLAWPGLERVVPVIAPADAERYQALRAALGGLDRLAPAAPGGPRRQDSVQAGLEALPQEIDTVAVHDAARPLVRPEDVGRVVAAAERSGAALLVGPVADTLKRVAAGRVVETPERAACRVAQTPQVFRRALLEEGLAKARALGREATDDAQLVEWLGVAVQVVEGDPANFKITHPADLARAEAWLRWREEGAA